MSMLFALLAQAAMEMADINRKTNAARAAVSQFIDCTRPQLLSHYQDPVDAESVAKSALEACQAELKNVNSTASITHKTIWPNISQKRLDGYEAEREKDFVAAMVEGVKNLRAKAAGAAVAP